MNQSRPSAGRLKQSISRIPIEHHVELRGYAARRSVPMGHLIREIIAKAVKQIRQGKDPIK